MQRIFALVLVCFSLGACTDWIYRIDIPQGNFLDQRSVEKLRIQMTKEQVVFVLGKPVVKDMFDHDTWQYFYAIDRGMKARGEDMKKSLVLKFVDNRLVSATGDYQLSADFNTPLE